MDILMKEIERKKRQLEDNVVLVTS